MAKSTSVQVETPLAAMDESSIHLRDVDHLSAEDYAAVERRLVRKIDLRLMPVLFAIIVLK